MMQAQHSIKILAWDLSFDVGLVLAEQAASPKPVLYDGNTRWITLEVSLPHPSTHLVGPTFWICGSWLLCPWPDQPTPYHPSNPSPLNLLEDACYEIPSVSYIVFV